MTLHDKIYGLHIVGTLFLWGGAILSLIMAKAAIKKPLEERKTPMLIAIFSQWLVPIGALLLSISGDVALKMGNILRTLSNEHQVITITHSPQVAAKADTHYFVYKEEMPERTLTCVKSLDKEGRIFSIASMLSQNPPSAFAIENAKELLGL